MGSEKEHNQILLRPREVASALGLSRSYVYRLLVEGEIPSVLIGKCRRVRPDVVEGIAEAGIS